MWFGSREYRLPRPAALRHAAAHDAWAAEAVRATGTLGPRSHATNWGTPGWTQQFLQRHVQRPLL